MRNINDFPEIIHILDTTECAPMSFDVDADVNVDVSCNLINSHAN